MHWASRPNAPLPITMCVMTIIFVIASAWFRQVAQNYPGLRKLATALADEEDRRARKRGKRWRHYWNSVQVLHPGKLW